MASKGRYALLVWGGGWGWGGREGWGLRGESHQCKWALNGLFKGRMTNAFQIFEWEFLWCCFQFLFLQIKFDLIWCFIIVLSLLGLILGFYMYIMRRHMRVVFPEDSCPIPTKNFGNSGLRSEWNRHFPEFHSEILGVPREVGLKFRRIGITE